MKAFGLLVFVVGLATFVPAQFELHSSLMGPISPYQPWGGIGAVLAGVLILWMAPKSAPARKK